MTSLALVCGIKCSHGNRLVAQFTQMKSNTLTLICFNRILIEARVGLIHFFYFAILNMDMYNWFQIIIAHVKIKHNSIRNPHALGFTNQPTLV